MVNQHRQTGVPRPTSEPDRPVNNRNASAAAQIEQAAARKGILEVGQNDAAYRFCGQDVDDFSVAEWNAMGEHLWITEQPNK